MKSFLYVLFSILYIFHSNPCFAVDYIKAKYIALSNDTAQVGDCVFVKGFIYTVSDCMSYLDYFVCEDDGTDNPCSRDKRIKVTQHNWQYGQRRAINLSRYYIDTNSKYIQKPGNYKIEFQVASQSQSQETAQSAIFPLHLKVHDGADWGNCEAQTMDASCPAPLYNNVFKKCVPCDRKKIYHAFYTKVIPLLMAHQHAISEMIGNVIGQTNQSIYYSDILSDAVSAVKERDLKGALEIYKDVLENGDAAQYLDDKYVMDTISKKTWSSIRAALENDVATVVQNGLTTTIQGAYAALGIISLDKLDRQQRNFTILFGMLMEGAKAGFEDTEIRSYITNRVPNEDLLKIDPTLSHVTHMFPFAIAYKEIDNWDYDSIINDYMFYMSLTKAFARKLYGK